MRYLTATELKLVMERPGALDLTPAEIVEALAVEVSERRLAEDDLIIVAEKLVSSFWGNDFSEKAKAAWRRDYPESLVVRAETALAAVRPARAEGRG